MLTRKKQLLLCGAIILAAAAVFAGVRTINNNKHLPIPADPAYDLKQIAVKYYAASRMALAGTIYLFEDARATSPKEVTPFKYFRQNLQTYAQLGRIRTYNANDVSLQVDSIDKTVVVSRQQLNAQPEFLESLLRDTANFKARSLNDENGLKVIEFINAQTPNIKACRIYYTPGTYELRHCTIEWWKDGAGEEATDTSVWITKIDYTGWACDMDVEKEIHDILSFDGRDPQLRTSYTGYQLTIL